MKTYALLAVLAHARLPLVIADRDEIDMLRSYLSAGLVIAEIPPSNKMLAPSTQPPARVLSVTSAGLRALRASPTKK